MMVLFIISVIVCAVFGSFFSLMVCSNMPKAKKWVRTVVGIAIALLFGFIFTCGMWLSTEFDLRAWNNGVCAVCDGEYEFRGGSEYRGSHTYYYTCNDCGSTIELNSLMK